MQEIWLSDDDLKRLEKRFGPDVRQMGPWISDGVFGYISVPIGVVEKAAELLNDSSVIESVSRLKADWQWNKERLTDLLESSPVLLKKIVFAHRCYGRESLSGGDERGHGQVVDWQLK